MVLAYAIQVYIALKFFTDISFKNDVKKEIGTMFEFYRANGYVLCYQCGFSSY